jgi:hypothetical protein
LEKTIEAVEEALGRPLPEDVKASYRIHDGQGPIPHLELEDDDEDEDDPTLYEDARVFFGHEAMPLRRVRGVSRDTVLGEWQSWVGISREFTPVDDVN